MKLNSKEATDVNWENHTNISNDFDETRIQPNAKYLESVAKPIGTDGCEDTTPGVLTHRTTMDATPLLTTDDTRQYRSCVGALLYYVLDRAEAQLEVSILDHI